jgi:ribonuclease R
MRRKKKSHTYKRKNLQQDASNPLSSRLSNDVFRHLHETGNLAARKEIIRRLEQDGYSSTHIKTELRRLISEGYLTVKGRSNLAPGPRIRLYQAVLEMTASGFGFAVDLRSSSGKKATSRDLYIHRSALNSARHGDTVLVLALPARSGRRAEGYVVAVQERSCRQLTGVVVHDRSGLTVYPEDPRYPFTIRIRALAAAVDKPDPGDAVVVALEDREFSGSTAHGTIVEVLGDPRKIEVLTRMMAEKHQLPFRFSPEAEAEAQQALRPEMLDRREDLRDTLHVTIDGDDAKDFDDAVAVEKIRSGYRLHVSIADVSALVTPGGRLDSEAYQRGTSVYFPGAVIPMLPENLSNNLCSLIPGEDRLAITASLEFDGDGVLLEKRFFRSVIRSHMRFTYDTVKSIVIDRDPEICKSFKTFVTPLKWASELAQALLAQRKRRGSIILNLPEADIRLVNGATVASVSKRSRHFAHQIIEEFMLAANEAVAGTFAERGAALLYRIHEAPDREKVAEFIDVSRILGLEIPAAPPTPGWFCSLVEQARDTDREFIVNNLLLRTMQQARYSPENCGHYGLGAPHYTHFTSPIRRYPDLIVHRLLCQMIDGGQTAPRRSPRSPFRSLQEAGLHLSGRERSAVTAERDMADKLKCGYIQGRIGERFRAIISSVTDSQIFIELLDHLIAGAILLSDLTDDYYLYDHRRYRLIGDVTGRVFQIGDILTVQALDVDLSRNKIFFSVVSGQR